jgi:hypothetical protein
MSLVLVGRQVYRLFDPEVIDATQVPTGQPFPFSSEIDSGPTRADRQAWCKDILRLEMRKSNGFRWKKFLTSSR